MGCSSVTSRPGARAAPGYLAALSFGVGLLIGDAAGTAAHIDIGQVLAGSFSLTVFFTLFVVPSIYMLVARDHSKDRHASSDSSPPPPLGIST